MSPLPATDEICESQIHDPDVESVSSPLLPKSQTPRCFPLLLRPFTLIWNSCFGCAFTGAAFLATGVVAAITLTNENVSAFQIFFIRGLISLSILVPLGYFQSGFILGPFDGNMKWILLRGSCAACGLLFSFLSAILMSLSEAALMCDSYPVILALMSWVLGIESIDVLSWVGILGAIVANILISRPPFLFGDNESLVWNMSRIIGLLFSFLTVFSLSSGFLIIGKIDKNVPPLIIGNHGAIQLMMISIPFLAVGFPEKIEWQPSATHVAYYFLAAADTLNQVFIVRAFQIGPPVKAAMCSLARVLLTVSAGIIFFSEQVTFMHAVGGILLISSVALVIWRRDQAKRKITQELLPDSTPIE